MGIVKNLFGRGRNEATPENEQEGPVSESFAFSFDMEKQLLARLRRLGGDPGTHVSVAVRAYLRARRGQPLPFEDLTGRLDQQATGTVVNWIVPGDLRKSALVWNERTGGFIRAAIKEYLKAQSVSLREAPRRYATAGPRPIPPQTVEVDITRPLLDKLKALGRPYGKHVERAVRQFLAQRAKMAKGAIELAGRVRGPDEYHCSETTITWIPPEDLAKVTPETVRAALRLCLPKPRWWSN